MAYNVYSLPDCRTVLYHPDVGTANLHQCGHGKITISSAGDLTSHTATADGYVVVNKLKSIFNFSWSLPHIKLPHFSISVALAYKNDIILGGVYDVCMDEMFLARKGKGATLNGKKINSPSYVVLKGQEDEIGFYRSSPVAKQIEEYNNNKDNKANTEE